MGGGDIAEYLQRLWRASLTPDALLTLDEVARALPGPPEHAASWAQRQLRPAATFAGVALFRWGDVLAALPGAHRREDNDWLTVAEATAELKVSERLLRRLLAEGALQGAAARVGRTWRLHRHKLETLLTQGGTHGLDQGKTTPQQGDGPPGDVLRDRVARRDRQEPHQGPGVLRKAGSHPPAQAVRGQTGGRPARRTGAAAFRAFLTGAHPDDPDPA